MIGVDEVTIALTYSPQFHTILPGIREESIWEAEEF